MHGAAYPAGAAVWDDTTSTIAAWRDLHHIAPEQPGLGAAPTDPHEREQWYEAMATTLAQRAWLSNREPGITQAACPALTPIEIHDRISELDQIFANAPTDHSRIIDDLVTGHLTTPDLHAALSAATAAQTERDRWILASWPYIVEHHELQRLAEQHDPLAHWPTPTRPTVEAILNKLASRLDPTVPTGGRSLGELHAAKAALDPGARLRDLTEQLVTLNDRLHHIETHRSAEKNPDRIALLVAESESLRAHQHDVRTLIGTERQTINRRTLTPTDHETLRAAISRRTVTIYQQAISQRPEWLIDLLTDLDDRGTLGQVRLGQIRELILNKAATDDFTIGNPTLDARRGIERNP